MDLFEEVIKAVTKSKAEEDKHQCLVFVGDRNTAAESYFAWKADLVDKSFKMKC